MADVSAELSLIAHDKASDLRRPRKTTTKSSHLLSFEAVTEVSQFVLLEKDWNGLTQQGDRFVSVFLDFAWLKQWVDVFLAPNIRARRLAIIIGRAANGQVAFIAPFQMEHGGGISQLCWMGCPIAQYGDVLAVPEYSSCETIRAAIAFAIKTFKPDLVRLCKVREDSHVTEAVRDGWANALCQDVAREVDFGDAQNFEDYEQRYSSKSRKNRRRLLRRLKERHEVKFRRHEPGDEAAHIALVGLSLKRCWLVERGLKSTALDDGRVDRFIAKLAQEPVSGCCVYSVTCDERLAGIQIGFERNGRLELYLIVFDLAFEKSGIGTLHLENTISDACDSGTKCVDLLAPDAPYKRDWADRGTTVRDYAKPCTVAGHIYTRVYLLGIRKLLKRAQEQLPLRVRKTALRVLR